MRCLSIRLLGPFAAELDGQHLSGFRSNKVRALLAYLMVEWRRPWSRTTLAGLLWPDLPEIPAQSNLRNALSNLRHVLEDTASKPTFILLTENTLQFNRDSDSWLDLHAFLERPSRTDTGIEMPTGETSIHQLEVALALYQGEFMEGFSVDSAPLEEWILATREQARQRLLQILRKLALEHEQWGELDSAFEHTRRYLELEPWDEAAYRYQMQLLSALDRRSAALAVYDECCSRLARDLGIKPEAETVRLYGQLRDGIPGVSPVGSSLLPVWTGIEILSRRHIPDFLVDDHPSDGGLQRFFARRRELGLLERTLEDVYHGRGRIYFLTGEPGSGKTALLAEFSRRAMFAHPDLLVAWGQCSAFTGQGDPYYPFLNILRMLAGEVEIPVSTGVITKGHAQRLWKFLPHTLDALIEHGPGLFNRFLSGKDLLSLARSNINVPADTLKRLQACVKGASDPLLRTQLSQAGLFDQLTQVVYRLAQRHPLILVLDDLQWIDPGSVNLLFHLARQIAGSKILILGAYRPEEVIARRSPDAHLLQGAIQELSAVYGDIQLDLMRSEGAQFVKELIQSEPNELDQHFQDSLYHRTSGNPLFAIELLRGMQLRGDIFKNNHGRWIAKQHLNWEELPGRVEAVIARRIGHLSEESRELLNIACVEGEQFAAEVIAGVLEKDAQRVCDLLRTEVSKQHQIVTAVSMQQVGGQTLTLYRFRHSLFQIYLYNHLDWVEKQQLHGKVGGILEQHYARDKEKLAEVAHVLARHFESAGLIEKTIQYYTMAGKYSIQLSASRAAIDHFQHALHHLQSLPESENRDWQALDLYLSLGPPITASHGWAAPELEKYYLHAEALCHKLADDARLVPALWLLAVYRLGRSEHHALGRLGTRFYDLAQKIGDPDLLCLANLQVSPLYQGRLIEARQILMRASQPRDVAQQRSLAYRYGMSPSVVALAYLSHCHWLMGDDEGAVRASQEALDLAEKVDVPMTSCYALGRASWQNAFAGQIEATRLHAEKQLHITRQHEFRNFELGAHFLLAWADAQSGESILAQVERMYQVMQEYQSLGTIFNRTTFLILFAQVCAQARQLERGLAALEEAINVGVQTGERWFEAEAYRLKGDLLLRTGQSQAIFSQAEQCLKTARQIAIQQGAKALEARANASLSHLKQIGGRFRIAGD
jgi:predicted ATPase/DNA-binding SARP family transcriptional activator